MEDWMLLEVDSDLVRISPAFISFFKAWPVRLGNKVLNHWSITLIIFIIYYLLNWCCGTVWKRDILHGSSNKVNSLKSKLKVVTSSPLSHFATRQRSSPRIPMNCFVLRVSTCAWTCACSSVFTVAGEKTEVNMFTCQLQQRPASSGFPATPGSPFLIASHSAEAPHGRSPSFCLTGLRIAAPQSKTTNKTNL